jgi:hypothetical protein
MQIPAVTRLGRRVAAIALSAIVILSVAGWARADLSQRYFVGNFLGYTAEPDNYISLSGAVSRGATSGGVYLEKTVSPVSSLSMFVGLQHYGGNDAATGWTNLELSYKHVLLAVERSDFLLSIAPTLEVPTGDPSIGAETHPRAGADLLFEKGLAEIPDSLAPLRAIQLEGDYFWDSTLSSAHDDVVVANTEIEYSLDYLDKYVSSYRGSEFLHPLTPHLDFEYLQYLSARDNSPAPEFELTPAVAWINRTFEVNVGLQVAMNRNSSSTGSIGFVWLVGASFDQLWPPLGWMPFR